MAQKLGYPKAGIEGAHTAVDQLLVCPGGIAVAQAMVGHGTGGIFILNLGAHFVDVLLEPPDGYMGGHAVRHK